MITDRFSRAHAAYYFITLMGKRASTMDSAPCIYPQTLAQFAGSRYGTREDILAETRP